MLSSEIFFTTTSSETVLGGKAGSFDKSRVKSGLSFSCYLTSYGGGLISSTGVVSFLTTGSTVTGTTFGTSADFVTFLSIGSTTTGETYFFTTTGLLSLTVAEEFSSPLLGGEALSFDLSSTAIGTAT